MNGQYIQEKMITICYRQGNANENHDQTPPLPTRSTEIKRLTTVYDYRDKPELSSISGMSVKC